MIGLGFDDYYDVKKGTFLWYATMDNKTITEFPVLEPIGNLTYNKIGGDGPNVETGWEIEYESSADIETLTEKFVGYLKSDGYKLEATQFNWTGIINKNETNRLYSGSNGKGESLDLLLQRQKNGSTSIKCLIVY